MYELKDVKEIIQEWMHEKYMNEWLNDRSNSWMNLKRKDGRKEGKKDSRCDFASEHYYPALFVSRKLKSLMSQIKRIIFKFAST